ncbi:MAG: CotH kinase family protein [Clostridia bacterium]
MKKCNTKKVTGLILAICIFMTGIVGVVFAQDLQSPVFSHEGGIYTEGFTLTIDAGGNNVYYTTDGSIPTEKSNLYTKEIVIDPVKLSPRTIQGRVSQERMEKGVVIRAVSIDKFGNSSPVVTNTYFVSEKIAEIGKNVPVVALSASPYDLWDSREGIYTNYEYEHNITGYVEYFDNNAEGFERSLEFKVSGHGSRSNPKKSIRLYFTKGDTEGRKNLEYNMIEGTDKNFYDSSSVKKYGKVTFRISDWTDTDLKDPVAQKITEFMRPESANSTPVALFLNGEFWGIYECREQYDNRYLDFHYENIGKDDVVFLDRDWTTENEKFILSDNGQVGVDRILYEEGPKDDEAYYRDQFNYVQYLMANAENDDVYKELSAYLDIDSYIDYLFICLYCDNIDWPGNNYKFWRTTMERSTGDAYGADGKWRFMVHDFDLAFDGVNNNTFEYAIKSNLPETEPRHPEFAAKTIDGLFKNEDFRNRFAQRASSYLSTAVSVENMTKITEDLISERESVKGFDLLRWNNQSGSGATRLEGWKNSTRNKFIGFATGRNSYFERTLMEFYKKYYNSEISDGATFTFEIESEKASVDISGAVIRKDFYGDNAHSFTTKQYTNIPVTITAECKIGYVTKAVIVEHGGSTQRYEGSTAVFIPENGDYKVTFDIQKGEDAEKTVTDITIIREERFKKMKVNEKLPVEILETYPDGSYNKAFGFTVNSDSDLIEIGENGIITAKVEGSAVLTVSYKGITKNIDIVIE